MATEPRVSKAPLVEDVDYMLTGETYRAPHPNGSGWVHNSGVVRVYLAAANGMSWMCDSCKAYTNENPRSVFAHRATHSRNPAGEMQARKAAAFDLLPTDMQKTLLKRLRAEKNGDGHG